MGQGLLQSPKRCVHGGKGNEDVAEQKGQGTKDGQSVSMETFRRKPPEELFRHRKGKQSLPAARMRKDSGIPGPESSTCVNSVIWEEEEGPESRERRRGAGGCRGKGGWRRKAAPVEMSSPTTASPPGPGGADTW